MGTAITKEPTSALAVFSLFCFGQGVGNVMAGPISIGLVKRGEMEKGYGNGMFRDVVVYTGVCMAVSALCVGSWYLRPDKLRKVLS